mmetsp:Transcript_4653/g.8406  ORF Transcript_4653/g.8406 Transcript_4653/m.8406 type:complete len:126 (-) Transcript_4653:123-500(-)
MRGAGISGSNITGLYDKEHPLHSIMNQLPQFTIQCDCYTTVLGSLANTGCGRIVIKMDCEGYESQLLVTVLQYLVQAKVKFVVQVSFHDVFKSDTEEGNALCAFLSADHLNVFVAGTGKNPILPT